MHSQLTRDDMQLLMPDITQST